MPRVDFHEVTESDWEAAACRLVEAAYEAGERVYVCAESEAQARRLDDLLWSFREESFVPHDLWQGETPPLRRAPVTVGWHLENPCGAGCLCLFRPALPNDILGFERVIDLVPNLHRALKAAARARYRAFREAGFDVRFHPASP